jgi:hypothetical protein
MRAFMKQVVDQLYTVLLRLDDPAFVERLDQPLRAPGNRGAGCAGKAD